METGSIPSVVVLSDDLTGTLGLAILMANINLSVRALTGSALHSLAEERVGNGTVCVVNTESRSLIEDDARCAIRDVLRQLPEDTVIAKRFDTTLRGHIAAELSVIMEHRPAAAAIVVPSYPASGRLCIGGYQLMNGTPLERTEVADDTHWPIRNSFVPDHFASTTGTVHFIPLNELYEGEASLSRRIRECATAGAVIVIDAFNDADIALIAGATVPIERELILVSPGSFIATVLGLRCRRQRRRIAIAAIGSPTLRTRDQVQALEQPFVVRYLAVPLSAVEEERVDAVVGAFLSSPDAFNADVIVVRPERERAASSLQPRICFGIAVAVEALIERIESGIAGLIFSGGETATAVLDRLDTSVIRPEVEFGSLVMGGVMLDGALAGTKIVTKGGLVGDRSIFIRALTWFLKENER